MPVCIWTPILIIPWNLIWNKGVTKITRKLYYGNCVNELLKVRLFEDVRNFPNHKTGFT